MLQSAASVLQVDCALSLVRETQVIPEHESLLGAHRVREVVY